MLQRDESTLRFNLDKEVSYEESPFPVSGSGASTITTAAASDGSAINSSTRTSTAMEELIVWCSHSITAEDEMSALEGDGNFSTAPTTGIWYVRNL